MSDVLTCIAGSQLAATQSSVTRPLLITVKPKWTMCLQAAIAQLAGEAVVPYGVISCCEVDEHSSGLLFS